MISSALLAFVLAAPVQAEETLSDSETTFTGASILAGESDVFFNDVEALVDQNTQPYAFFTGNTLYAGNSDIYGNSVDAIIEFYWFQSSVDRGSDFYVAVIKTRATPGHSCLWAPWDDPETGEEDCHLWVEGWGGLGAHPVLKVNAGTDIEEENGAFRWDWSLPFENYGIEAVGQVTISNSYGVGFSSEGAILAHGEYEEKVAEGEPASTAASGDVQVKGYVSADYAVKTQYVVNLYEWDVFVTGRADLVDWELYLNNEARNNQSAYHEYFLAIQVEEGESFTLDNLQISAGFDIGWLDPYHHPLGVDISQITIYQPEWTDDDPDTGTTDTGDTWTTDTGYTWPTDTGYTWTDTGDATDTGETDGEDAGGCGCTTGGGSGPAPVVLFMLSAVAFFGRRRLS
jgi:MYXO-CTERM domain-containing protein